MDYSNFQLPPPKDWPAFERLCHRLFARIWNDPHTVFQGRSGQNQQGVDLYGRPAGAARYIGVQCKSRDQLTGGRLTRQEIRNEVEKAKQFQPPLGEVIIATSAPADADLQEYARTLTEAHQKDDLFSVHIYAWPELEKRLHDHPEVRAQIYPQLGSTSPVPLTEATHERIGEQLKTFGDELLQRLSHPSLKTTVADDGPAHAQVDLARDLIRDREPLQAIKLLERIREREWATTPNAVRFRILTNLGAAHWELGHHEVGAQYIFEAEALEPDSEKTLTNRVTALWLTDRLIQADEAAQRAVRAYPRSPSAWAARITLAARAHPQDPLPVPDETVSQRPEVQFALADAYALRGQWAEAEPLIRSLLSQGTDSSTTASTATGPRLPHRHLLLSRLADILTAQIGEDGKLYAGMSYAPGQVPRLREADALYTEAWQAVKDTDLAAVCLDYPQNRVAIRMGLGEFDTVQPILEEALAVAPDHPALLSLSARSALARHDAVTARRYLNRLPRTLPEYPIVEVAVLREERQPVAALAVLEDYLASSASPEASLSARCLFADIVCECDLEHAEARFDALPPTNPLTQARSTLILARALNQHQQAEAAQRRLADARGPLESSSENRDQVSIAEALSELGEKEAAVALYEQVLSRSHDSPALRDYFRCLFGLDRRQQLATQLRELPPEVLERPFYQLVSAQLAVRAGDLPTARAHFERCFTVERDRLEARIPWAETCIRLNDPAPVETWLAGLDLEGRRWRAAEWVSFGVIYNALGRTADAARVLYRARRRFPNDVNVNIAFTASILFKGVSPPWELPPDPVVAADLAVGLEDEHDQETVYILEERVDSDHTLPEEITVDSPLGSRLIGHRVDDPIITYSGPLTTRTSTIRWIKHKYVHALHATLNTFNTRFPDSNALVGMSFAPTENAQAQFAPVLEAIDRKADQTRQVLDLYHEQRWPMAALAELLGLKPTEVWRMMIGPQHGRAIEVCAGNAAERNAALALLRDPGHRFIVEPIALLELHTLDLLEVAEQICGPLGVVQSSLDELREQIAHQKLHPNGYMTLGRRAEQRVRVEVSAEEVERERTRFEDLLHWAETHCRIIPAIPKSDLPAQTAQTLQDALGTATYDTLLAAQGANLLLLSDDFHLRNLARNELNISGVWLQPLLFAARDKSLLTTTAYSRAIGALVEWRHRFISVGPADLEDAAERADWQVIDTFRLLAGTLSLRTSELQSNVRVAVKFLGDLWTRRWTVPPLQAEALTYALLEGVNPGGATELCVPYYQHLAAYTQAGQLPRAAMNAVTGWYRMHFLPPVVGSDA